MPICTVSLLALTAPLPTFLHALRIAYPDPSTAPLVVSRVIRWMITPSTLSVDPLLTQKPQWDLLLITRGATPLPSSLAQHIRTAFTLQAGVPSSLVSNFPDTNKQLLHPEKGNVPPLTGALEKPRMASSAQNLEFTPETAEFIQKWDPEDSKGAVSMLNLLAFKEGMHGEYLKYGKAFAESIGRRRGGVAKIVGRVVDGEKGGWEEVALAHYPSIRHFADMAASEDYQEVNHKHRVGSLRDTCILCTSELDLPAAQEGEEKAKL